MHVNVYNNSLLAKMKKPIRFSLIGLSYSSAEILPTIEEHISSVKIVADASTQVKTQLTQLPNGQNEMYFLERENRRKKNLTKNLDCT